MDKNELSDSGLKTPHICSKCGVILPSGWFKNEHEKECKGKK